MYRRNNPLKIGKGYREQDLLTLRVELTVARVECCKRDKNYFSYTYIRVSISGVCTKKWTNLDDLSPDSCGYEFNRFDAYETKNIFPASTFLFELFPFKRTMFTRRCFARSSRLWIIIKLLCIDLDSKARDLYTFVIVQ